MLTRTERDANIMLTRCKCDNCAHSVKNWRGFSSCKHDLHPRTKQCGLKYQVKQDILILNANQAFKGEI